MFLKEFRIDNLEDKTQFISEITFYSQNSHISMINQIGVYLFLYPVVYIVYEYYTTTTLGDLIRLDQFQEMTEKTKSQLIIQILH